MRTPLAYQNGMFLPANQVSIPLTDAGFVLGVTISEQLRTFRGSLFRPAQHWRRLARSLEIAGMTSPLPLEEIDRAAEELAKYNYALLENGDDLGLAVAITPGTLPSFARAGQTGPTVNIHTFPLAFDRWSNAYRDGVRLRTTPYRQVSPANWPAELKCRSRMHYHLADQSAATAEQGARALLLDEFGQVNETSSANVLVVRGPRVISPPRARILRGISWEVTAELVTAAGWVFEDRPIELEELQAAEEVLLTSTPFGILPAVSCNGQAIGTGQPGPVFGELLGAWSELTGVDLASQAARMSKPENWQS
ncbi:MAG: aminotransferase class IV [Pirellulales bacterium]|nr:aminotransferase class IV [Pirellulales bacterium]